MPLWVKEIPNVGEAFISNCEIVLTRNVVANLDDKALVSLVRELASDLEYVYEYVSKGYCEGNTIDELKLYVRRESLRPKAKETKHSLTQQRRREFGARRKELMLALLAREDVDYVCQHPGCGSQEDLTIDHIVPLSKGGTDHPSNLQWLCRKHNSAKGDR
jgi:hypothetical protein